MVLATEANLSTELEQLLSASRRQPVRIVALDRRANPYATLAPNEILTVTTAGSETIQVFLKHLIDQQPDHPNKQRRDREIRIYENLLAHDRQLPVPGYYGSQWQPHRRTGWLALEYVDDWSLKYHDLEHWYEAARQLGRLQVHFAGEIRRLRSADFLLQLNESYFSEWFVRALNTAATQSPGVANVLIPVTERVADVAHLLGRYAQTLVHNDLAPKNVVASRATSPARICLLDWEMAGVGCGLLDLIQLKDGLEPQAAKAMADAYFQQLTGAGLLPASPTEIERVCAACEIHKIMYRLARCSEWGLPPETLQQWASQAREFLQQI